MRSKKEILISGEDKRHLQLEVLLDIRDLIVKATKKQKSKGV